jgi:hypothetical protein
VPTAFRDHLILGYEILKWGRGLAQPTVNLAEQKGNGGGRDGSIDDGS